MEEIDLIMNTLKTTYNLRHAALNIEPRKKKKDFYPKCLTLYLFKV